MNIFLRAITVFVIVVIALVGVGCGLCGLMGVVTMVADRGRGFIGGLPLLGLTLLGLGIAVGCVFAIGALLRALGRPDQD